MLSIPRVIFYHGCVRFDAYRPDGALLLWRCGENGIDLSSSQTVHFRLHSTFSKLYCARRRKPRDEAAHARLVFGVVLVFARGERLGKIERGHRRKEEQIEEDGASECPIEPLARCSHAEEVEAPPHTLPSAAETGKSKSGKNKRGQIPTRTVSHCCMIVYI